MTLVDQFSRKINYLRVSVTDRCDLRCVYCMKEKMTFLPKSEILTLEEIEQEIIVKTLKKFNSNRRKTAKVLNISERTLYRKINEYGMDKKKNGE